MDTTTDKQGQETRARKAVAHRRDLTYQFPVYRWLSWLVVVGFAIGLGLMYLMAGMFGLSAPLVWAALVVVLLTGIFLLERPKTLLRVMMFYTLFMPSNRLLGLIGLPLPGFLDELFFLPFIAVIVMNWIQRSKMPSGSWFALAFMGVAVTSWYVNRKPAPFTAVQVTLIMMKFFIVWYYCRLTSTFKDMNQFWKWGRLYIYYAAVQFLYNCLWHGRPWTVRHPDCSGGVFGPDGTGAAHFVGYISVLALCLLVGWFGSEGRRATKRQKWWMGFLGLVIAYDLVFMTDTKNALVMMPVPFALILFHRRVSAKFRTGLLAGGLVVGLGAAAYLGMMEGQFAPLRKLASMSNSPKGEAYRAVTTDFHYLVPYPVFGAGPGRFFSPQAALNRTPLARRYVTPYQDEIMRWGMTHVAQSRTGGGSMLLSPAADALTLMGDFGWLGTFVYAAFMGWIWWALWQKANRAPPESGASPVFLAMAAGTLFLDMTILVTTTCTAQPLMFPWWMLMGCLWDMPVGGEERKGQEDVLPIEALPEPENGVPWNA